MDKEEGAGVTFHVHIYIHVCVHISPCGGNDKKPRKIPQTGDNHRTQSYPEDESLDIAKPQRQQHCIRWEVGRRGHSPPWVSVQSSSGLLVSGPGCLRPSAGAFYDIHVFKLLSRSRTGRVFLLKQQLFLVLGLCLKQKTGLFVNPLLVNSLSSWIITENTGTDSTNCHHNLKPLYGSNQQKTSKFASRSGSWAVAEYNSSPFLLEIDPEQKPCVIFQYQELIVVPAPWNTGDDPFGSSKLEVPQLLAWGK